MVTPLEIKLLRDHGMKIGTVEAHKFYEDFAHKYYDKHIDTYHQMYTVDQAHDWFTYRTDVYKRMMRRYGNFK